ncbi:MAG: hypothetical protein AB1752_05885 [Candidatus Zixiibacteriota bacterium]
MGRIRARGIGFLRVATVAVALVLLLAPLPGNAGDDGTSGGFPPPDSTRQPIIDPGSHSAGLITDVYVLLASPWMSMI